MFGAGPSLTPSVHTIILRDDHPVAPEPARYAIWFRRRRRGGRLGGTVGGFLRTPLCGQGFLGGDLFEPGRRHRARLVVDGLLGRRPVETDPIRIVQDRPAIALAGLPHAQHTLGVRRTPAERLLQFRHYVHEGADLMGLGRERLRPSGAKKLERLPRVLSAALPVGLDAHGRKLVADRSRRKTGRCQSTVLFARALHR